MMVFVSIHADELDLPAWRGCAHGRVHIAPRVPSSLPVHIALAHCACSPSLPSAGAALTRGFAPVNHRTNAVLRVLLNLARG